MALKERVEPGLLKLEIAVFSGATGLRAQNLGAQRIELNAPGSYEHGGLTPPVSELVYMARRLKVPVRIMIRPRGAPADGSPDFIYTDAEIEQMCRSIDEFKKTSVLNPIRGDAFVFGVIRKANEKDLKEDPDLDIAIDVERCTKLVDRARPYGSIFHRAFDPIAESNVWHEGIDTLVECGFTGLLTAGGTSSAAVNGPQLVLMARRISSRMELICGGGLRSFNINEPASHLSCYPELPIWLHSSAIARPDACEASTEVPEEIDQAELSGMLKALALAKPD